MRDERPAYGQRWATLGVVVLLLTALLGLTTGPVAARAGDTAVLAHRPAVAAVNGTPDPKSGVTGVTGTSFSNAELGFSVSWEEGTWAAQPNHSPTAGALAGVLLISPDGGLLYIDAIPAASLEDAAGCVESNQAQIEDFASISEVAPLADEDGTSLDDADGDPAWVISTLEIDGEPAYLDVACASIDEGDAFLAFTYYLAQGDGLAADAFISGWLPDVQAVIDSLELT